jgi:hypothetical protein
VWRIAGRERVSVSLGATRRDVLGLILRQAFVLVWIGVVVGLVFAIGASRLMASQRVGISPFDVPPTRSRLPWCSPRRSWRARCRRARQCASTHAAALRRE